MFCTSAQSPHEKYRCFRCLNFSYFKVAKRENYIRNTLRKPGRRHGWGSADFLHFLAVFYFHSVMLKGNIFIFKHLIVFEIRPPPQKIGRYGREIW